MVVKVLSLAVKLAFVGALSEYLLHLELVLL